MATFVSTLKFTAQGIKAVGETTKRAAGIKSMAKKHGIKVREIFWTLGDSDGLLIFDAENDENATALMLRISALGNVHSSTVRAFSATEMDKILAKTQG